MIVACRAFIIECMGAGFFQWFLLCAAVPMVYSLRCFQWFLLRVASNGLFSALLFQWFLLCGTKFHCICRHRHQSRFHSRHGIRGVFETAIHLILRLILLQVFGAQILPMGCFWCQSQCWKRCWRDF